MYKNLKAFRESIGITQKDFAASLGIGLTTYNAVSYTHLDVYKRQAPDNQ